MLYNHTVPITKHEQGNGSKQVTSVLIAAIMLLDKQEKNMYKLAFSWRMIPRKK